MVTPATIAARIEAMAIDLVVLVAAILLFPFVPDALADSPLVRAVLLLGTVFLLEPLSIRLFGRTPGQAVLGLHVLPAHGSTAVGLPRLVLRYWLKLVLGALSFYFALFSDSRQALHDRAVGTAVVHVPEGAAVPSTAPPVPARPEGMPPSWRRFLVFLLWYFLAEIVLGIAIAFGSGILQYALTGSVNLEAGERGSMEHALETAGTVFLLLDLAYLGAEGRLLGARRRRARMIA